MKAAIITKYGHPEGIQIQEIEKPVMGDNEVLVRVQASTVSVGDSIVRQLTFLKYIFMLPVAKLFGVKKLRKRILGHEFSGVVDTKGVNVKKFAVGDKVFGTTGFEGGAHAEYITVAENGIISLMPETLSFEAAAALPIGGICALHFLNKVQVKPGQNVLVYGASGSIGAYAIQILKHYQANVTGVCSTQNLKMIAELGAQKTIDYKTEDYRKSETKYDLIFDAVGKIFKHDCTKIMAKNGKFISVRNGLVVERIEDLLFVKELVEKDELRPVIDKTYPLEQVFEAHRYVDTGRKKGNVVISVTNS